jgi:hypothetical protein
MDLMEKIDKESLEFLKSVASNDLEIASEYLPDIQDAKQDFKSLREVIKLRVTELIEQDFEHLLYLLYRTDVSELRLKKALDSGAPSDAPDIITDFLIERQMRKFETRKRFSENEENDADWSDDL